MISFFLLVRQGEHMMMLRVSRKRSFVSSDT